MKSCWTACSQSSLLPLSVWSYDHQPSTPLPQTHRGLARAAHLKQGILLGAGNETELQLNRRVCVCEYRSRPGAAEALMAGLMSGSGATRGQRGHFTCLTLLSALLTCCVRCAEPSVKPSNIILIVTDDQDVHLGGMVSWSSMRRIISRIDLEGGFINSDFFLYLHLYGFIVC